MGKNYLITSGTDGIGRAIAEKILEKSDNQDDRVIVNYGHNDEKARLFLERNKGDADKIVLIKADLSDYDNMCRFTDEVLEQAPELDHVVCNTGISAYGSFDDYTWEMWRRVIDTNLSIPAFMLQRLKYHIKNDTGSVVMMGSAAGVRTYSSSVCYSVSKAGLIHLAKVMVKEFEPLGVRINAVAPGFIETSWQKDRSKESYERINRKIAMHRFGEPEEVASMVYELMSNGYVNGNVVEVGGGYEYF